jgi:hypothetical protein
MGQTDMFKLVQHLIVQDDGKLPLIPDCLYAYIMAGNGVFLYAKRDDLEVLIPVSRATTRPAARTVCKCLVCLRS